MQTPQKLRPMKTLSEWVEGPVTLKPNKSIELEDGDFIRIKSIHKDSETTEVFLRGWRFRRASDMNGILKKNQNEICLVIDLTEGDTITDNERYRTGDDVKPCGQGLEDVPLSEFKKVRRVILTNERHPAHSFRLDGDRHLPKEQVSSDSVLVCRTKYVVLYKRGRFRLPNYWCEKAVVWLRASEVDPLTTTSDEELRKAWRGPTEKGGSRVGFLDGELDFDGAERKIRSMGVAPKEDKSFLSLHTLERKPSRGSLTDATSSAAGSRASSPINLDPDSPTEQKQQRRTRLQKVEVLYQISNNAQTKLSLETVPVSDSEDDVQITSPPNLTSTRMLGSSSADQPIKRRHAAGRSVSPELYGVHVVNRSKMGTLETDISSSFTPAWPPPISGRTRAPATPPSTPRNPNPQRRKRSLREDDEVVEFPAGFPTPETQPSSIRRRLFTSSPLQNPDRFTSNPTKPARRENMAFRTSRSQTEKASVMDMPRCAIPPSTALLNEPPATPTSRSSRPSKAVSPLTTHQKTIRRYTFGDAFCGAGGTSRGAKMAGLRVEWGFDFAENPISSYQSNFFGAHAYHASADLFTQLQDDDHKVDILHISPPCQPFSPAHTVDGKDDETNEASFFGAPEIIKKTRPRIVTLEQTSGLVERRDRWFTAMIHSIAELGFSVRWKVVNLADYGLPQARKRLILIASCAGESLPGYPKPIHTTENAVSVNEIINTIPDGFPNHDVTVDRDNPAWDGDKPLKYTITCSGGGNYHPSGKRDFTLREFACLQGFPLEHKFTGNAIKKQIGNAVPPCAAKAFFGEIIKHLKKVDGV
ncbi:MAG: hypothetical protein M1839_006920 [Geoglossum umbratile]|nr:MAG: hypothetical protein M1839_006920 [Geoglossum umbratile]